MHHRHPVAATLLTGCHRHTLPMALFLGGAFTAQAQHTALGHQGLDAGHAQLGGFFHQPVHAFIGWHAHRQVNLLRSLTLRRRPVA